MNNKVTFLDLNNPVLRGKDDVPTLNLGALYIISALEEENYDVDYRDYQISKYNREFKIDNIVKLAENSEDVLMICSMAYMLPLVLLACERIKAKDSNKIIILGGVGPTGVAEEIISRFNYIDFVVKGEGEETLALLLNNIYENGSYKSLSDIKGIVYRDSNNSVIDTGFRERNTMLDSIKFPAYHKVDMSKYGEFGIITGRGCAYKCKFCDIHGLWGDKYFQRSLDNVFEELKLLYYEYGVREIRIWDDTFTMSNKRVIEFCDRLKSENLDIKWTCFARVNLVNEELLSKMASSGCAGVFYGLESGSDEILEKIDKKITVDTMLNAIELTKRYMVVKGHFIWGFPFESKVDLQKTLYLYSYLKRKIEVSMSQLWPYPTSPLYKEFSEKIPLIFNVETFNNILTFSESNVIDREETLKLIREHREVFTQYYYYHTDSFYDMYAMVKETEYLLG